MPVDEGLVTTAERHSVDPRSNERHAAGASITPSSLHASIIEDAADAIFAVSSDGTIIAWNGAAELMFGRGSDETIGEPISSLECDGDEGFWHTITTDLAEVRGPIARDCGCMRADGSRIFVNFSISPLRNASGRHEGFSVITRDVTPQHLTHEELEHSLSEKELLLKEIHHRVKNNLQVICSLLRLQSSYLEDGGIAKGMFRNSEERVKCMALVHEKLYKSETLSRVNFKGYVDELVNQLVRTYAVDPTAIQLKMELEDVELPIDRAVPCGLILNELVTNSLKHAFPGGRPGLLEISLKRLDSMVFLAISDNGVGLEPNVTIEGAKTLGLRVVHTLSQQLGALIEVDREGGTSVQLTFESEKKRPRLRR